MSYNLPDDWYIEPTGESLILDQKKVADEITRIRDAALEEAAKIAEAYWLEMNATKEAHYRNSSAQFEITDYSYNPDVAARSKEMAHRIRALKSVRPA